MELALKTVMLRETASWTQTAPWDKSVVTVVNVSQRCHCVHCLPSSPWLFLLLFFSALFLSSVFALTILPVQCTRLSNGVVWELYSNGHRKLHFPIRLATWTRRTHLGWLSVSSTEAGVVFFHAFDHCGPFYADFPSIEVETGKWMIIADDALMEKRFVIAENTQYKLI